MTVRYDKLWTLVKRNKMKKKDLATAADLSQYTMTKLNQSDYLPNDIADFGGLLSSASNVRHQHQGPSFP